MTSAESWPTADQVERTREVVTWYLGTHHGRPGEPGFASMYTDPRLVGPLAVDLEDLRAGSAPALHQALLATVMFQAIKDVIAHKILRGLPPSLAQEMATPSQLRTALAQIPCEHLGSLEQLRGCTLTKDGKTGAGSCSTWPGLACPLKGYTVALRRYGHFGRVPPGLVYMLDHAGVRDLPGLYGAARAGRSPAEASEWLLVQLSQAWRVNRKLASMFLSVVSNPDLLPGAPWSTGLDWRRFVVVDTNVDRFLAALGWRGPGTYRARERAVHALASRIALDDLHPGLHRHNPRVVQQAMFLFASRSNRLARSHDCAHRRETSCPTCPEPVKDLCPFGPPA